MAHDEGPEMRIDALAGEWEGLEKNLLSTYLFLIVHR